MAIPARSLTSFNTAIRSAVTTNHHSHALLLYLRMNQTRIPPDHHTLPLVLKAFTHLNTPEPIHTHVLKSHLSSHIFVSTALLDLYVKCRRLDDAHKLFVRMPERDVAVWNVMVTGFCKLDSLTSGFCMFRNMRLESVFPDYITVISLTQACARVEDANALKSVHCLGVRVGVAGNGSVANTWISAYAKCGDLVTAEAVFDGIGTDVRCVVSWNSMIAGYAFVGRSSKVIGFFCRMVRDGLRPDLGTIVSSLSSFAHSEAIFEGKLVHCLALKAGFDSDVTVGNTLISLYSKCGEVDAAKYCFGNMSERTRVSWTAMIGGYAKVGDIDQSVELFREMGAAGESPDAITVVNVLSACSETGALEIGRSMNWYAVAYGFQDDVVVRNALIDMYAKCGSIDDARRLFDSMDFRTTVSWTSMIIGYAMNGNFDDSVGLFSQMLESGLRPNHVTFLAVLQACTHGGFLEKGWLYFDMMRKVYHLNPTLEHYSCMVQLLGGQAKVKEALDFIRNMPIEPDAVVWGALQGACLTHHEAEIGEIAATRLLMLQPQDAVSYVAMSNIYAAGNKWEGVAKIRAMMRSKGVTKNSGQSEVYVNGKVHTFTVEDKSHPASFDVFRVFDSLALHLKDADHLDDSKNFLAELE